MQAIDTQDKQFHDGNGTTELGTILPAWWLNQIQAEILAVLAAGKVAPNKAQTNQLLNAINKLIAGAVINDLTSSNADKPLSALQGKVLSEQIASAVAGGFALRGSLGSRNLNDVIGIAHYGVWDNSTNTNAKAEKNYPITKAGTLFLLPSAYQGVQLYIPFDLNIIYIRHSLSNDNNNWSSWRIIDETINGLNSDSRTAALSAAMGKKLNEEKVAKSGDTMTGHLNIRADGYSSVRLHNDGERETRLETVPSRMTDIVFQIANRQGTTGGFTAYRFPNATSSQTIAYQSWVSEQLASKDSLKTVNFWQDTSAVYTNSGFYRANGKQINGIATPSLEIHIAHPSYSNNAYSRGIGFGYGDSFALTTTSWDKDGNYIGQKTILTEENGVMLSGDQSIDGAKTFTSGSIGVKNGSKNAVFGIGGSDTYIGNRQSNKYLQLRDDGVLSYSNDKVILYSDRSDDHNLDRTDKFATSRAVKRIHDIARQATPSGMIAYCAGSYPPAGWLKANGAAVSRTVYADLFAAIGTHFGAGNGSTTFNLPDLRGEFIRSWDDGRGVDNGRNFGTHQGDELRSHWHYLANNNSAGRGIAGTDLDGGTYLASHAIDGAVERYGLRKSLNNAYPNVGKTSDSGGSETRPRNIALLACIKI